ncbi:hypothetical protein JQ625_32840 [Bradyrhizobium diazoefficiens]|nr:hypothetical protein [Bradyrhizobium diazoefficiens]MBR0779632.1 hypothetical protein [Bradyrhizobium diazoefficiens]
MSATRAAAQRRQQEAIGGTGPIAVIRRRASITAASMRRMLPGGPRDQKAKRGGDSNWRLPISALAAPAEFSMDILRSPQFGTFPLLVR